MPLQIHGRKDTAQRTQASLPRDRSTSSERVEWDPNVKTLSKATIGRAGKCGSRGSNLRVSKRDAIGLDYLRVKRELALELPLMLAPFKKIKIITPLAPAAQPKTGPAIETTKKKTQEEQNGLPLGLEPRLVDQDRKSVPFDHKMKMEQAR